MQNPVKSNCFKGLYYLLNPLKLKHDQNACSPHSSLKIS